MSEKTIDMGKRHEAVAGTVEKWLGNPISRALIRLASGQTRHGSRLNLALKNYVGEEVPEDLGFRDKLASAIVRFVVDRGSESFGVTREKMKESLSDPIIRRGIANVIEGIARYGIKRPFTSIAPFLVVWNYTRLCNLRCKHCYEDASPDADTSDELTTEEAKRVIDELKDAGVVAIAFSGGEPLMRKDIYEVAGYAKKEGFYVAMATNGTLITREVARKIKKIFDYVEISLDGFERTHDEFRGVKGSWKRACEGIRNCVTEGIDTCVALTATHYNLDDIPDVIDFAEKDLGAKRVIIFNYIPVRTGRGIIKEDLTPQERWRLLKDLYSRLIDKGNPMTLYSTAPQYAVISWQFAHGPVIATHFTNEGAMKAMRGKTRVLAQFLGGCGAGRLYSGLEPNGDVEPCVFIPITIGNLKKQSLREIWRNSEVLKKIRNRDEFEGCGDCPYKNICGGCRARAYGYFGDLQAPDPACPYNMKYWQKAQEQIS
ncbi:MAG: radical SAM protein [Candidatus Hadarchaeota archaeon]|nr:radical SAM protein [Candidatus Hadarchaeota archaeon]